MLRVSAKVTTRNADLSMINGEVIDGGDVEFGKELMEFAGALAGGDAGELEASREKLLTAAGPEVLVDAAGVAANFQRMVRIADSMGIPVDQVDNEMINEIRSDLDLYRFKSAENSPEAVHAKN